MFERIRKIDKRELLIYISLLTLSFVAVSNKITHAIDIDEEMAIANIYRLAKNPSSSIFTSNWDAIQLASCLFYPFIYLFEKNDFEGTVFFCRIIAVIAQICFSIYILRFTSNDLKLNRLYCFIIAVLSFITTPKYVYNLDHSIQIMWFSTIATTEMYKYYFSNKKIGIYICGISSSLLVLAHPGMVVFVFAECGLLIYKKKYNDVLKIISTCFAVFLVFFSLFIRNNKDLFKNIFYYLKQITSEGSHGKGIIARIDVRIIYIFLFLSLVAFFIKTFFKTRNIQTNYWEVLILLYCISSIGYNLLITKAIFVFSEKYLLLAIYSLVMCLKNKSNIKWFGYSSLLLFAVCLQFSNQGIQSNCYYLIPMCLIPFAYVCNENRNLIINSITILIITSSLITVGYNSRVIKTLPSSIFENKNQIPGVLKYIKIDDFESEYHSELNEIKEIIYEKNITVVGQHAQTLSYVECKANITAPTCISSPQFDDQWIEYFEHFNINETFLLIDKDTFENLDNFINSRSFGRYVFENFCCEQLFDGDRIQLVKITRVGE